MSWIGVKLACYLLKIPLSMKQRTSLVCAVLDGLDAVPLYDLIEFRADGVLLINGVQADHDKVVKLRESARAVLNNEALALIREQVASISGRRGVSEGDSPEKLYFYRAALWWGGQEYEMLNRLALLK